MKTFSNLTFDHKSLTQLEQEVVPAILQLLKNQQPFVVFLHGAVGSGKSTLIRRLLYQLGYPCHLPIQSPTFSYVHQYVINQEKFAHCDFYRCNEDTVLDFNDFILDLHELTGLFLEWPNQTFRQSLQLERFHPFRIEIENTTGDLRNYRVARLNATSLPQNPIP